MPTGLSMKHLEDSLKEAFFEEKARPDKQPMVWKMLHELKAYHPQTFIESIEVALKAREIANFLNLSPCAALYTSLHDYGKRAVPLHILNITQNYAEKDHAQMREHTRIGYTMLMNRGFVLSAWIALTHHRYQEHPYPRIVGFYPPQLKTKNAKETATTYSMIGAIADQYGGFHRKNDMHGDVPLTPEQIKEKMISNKRFGPSLISKLYEHKILV